MLYYNSNKIIKAYKGTSIVNEINDYVSGGSAPTPRLPQGYTEVEWVGSTSSKNSSFDTLIAVGEVTGNTFSIEGKMWTVQQSGFAYLISNEWVITPYPNFTWRWNNNTLNFDTPNGIEPDVELSLSDMGDGLSGFTISSDGLTLRNPKSVSFFCGNSNTADNTSFTPWRQGYGKLYGDTKITKNGVLVSNLIPCKRDSDSRYGFYCSVRETFLTGTNLVGGNEVVPSGTTSETKAVFQYITDGGEEPTPPEPKDYSREYLTFDIVSGGTIAFKTSNNGNTRTISYSVNNGSTWTDITSSTSGTSFNVSVGDKVMLKGNNTGYTSGPFYNLTTNNFSNSTAYFNIEGNIMSLLYGDNFSGQTSIPSNYCFYHFFNGCNVCDASNLVMPATTLANRCYAYMFQGCTSLTTAPELPATTLAIYCYQDMFNGCTSLTTAPSILPATTLANACYSEMFYGCESLTTAPELPATTLADSCYVYMFNGCTSLTVAPELPATTLINYCYKGMFTRCTNLTTAPQLLARTLVSSCYANMFNGCTSLNSITCLATDISANACLNSWVNGVASSGTFVKDASMTSWTTGNNGIPNGWTVVDAT